MKKIMNRIKKISAKLRYVKRNKFQVLTAKERVLKITFMIFKLAVYALLALTIGWLVLAVLLGVAVIRGMGTGAQVAANVIANNKVWRRY